MNFQPELERMAEVNGWTLQADLYAQMGMGLEPFKADKRQVIGLGIELDEEGKGLLGWKTAE